MRIHQQIWNYFQRHSTLFLMGKGIVVVGLGMLLFSVALSMNISGTSAQAACASSDQKTTSIQSNDAHLKRTASRCIPNRKSESLYNGRNYKIGVTHNVFPFGTCTWWANQRYFQLHGIYVPWRISANAWAWTKRAYQFHWRVSNRPILGAIVDLQPWVEGAYGAGHVAVVEKILRNGHVIASNMSWGSNPWRITYVEFAPGPGVTFIIQ